MVSIILRCRCWSNYWDRWLAGIQVPASCSTWSSSVPTLSRLDWLQGNQHQKSRRSWCSSRWRCAKIPFCSRSFQVPAALSSWLVRGTLAEIPLREERVRGGAILVGLITPCFFFLGKTSLTLNDFRRRKNFPFFKLWGYDFDFWPLETLFRVHISGLCTVNQAV